MTAQQEVRAAWEDNTSDGLYLYKSVWSYHLQLGRWNYRGTVKDKEAVWQAGLDYTRKQQEEKRQLKSDIRWLSVNVALSDAFDEERCNRVVARLQAALADLQRGMKPEAQQ